MPYIPPPMPEQTFQACVVEAGQRYQVPSCILRAVHEIESSGDLRPGLVHSNTNGTEDYGATQINTVWINYFRHNFGVTASQIENDACLAVNGSAYIIRYEINASGDFWTGVGRYHSHTPSEHDRYVHQVAEQAQKFGCYIR
jgi:hypothetical protein